MFLPAAASILVTFAGLALVFRGIIPRVVHVGAGPEPQPRPAPLVVCARRSCVDPRRVLHASR